MSNDRPDHCVIGAGFAGLPVAKKLAELGQSFEILENNSEVGGIWHKGVYETAHLISSKRTTQYPSFPMPDSYPVFPGREHLRNYLSAYAKTFGLAEKTRFGCKVVRVRPNASGKKPEWLVEDQSGRVRGYRTVTIATGHFWKTRELPQIKHFTGEVINANGYDSPHVFRGKRVLVIGHANSGSDLAVDAANHATSVDISMRSGAHYFPRTIFGVPSSDLLYYSPLKFDFLDRLIARGVAAVSVGKLEHLGLPRPSARILDKHPIVNAEFIEGLRLGRIKVRPEVEYAEDRCVYFKGGESAEYDLIATAIGYDVSLPMFDKSDTPLDWHGDLPILYFNLIAPRVKGLFFAGFAQARAGGGPLFEGYGSLIARMATWEIHNKHRIFDRLNRLKRLSFLPRIFGVKPIAPMDMRSRGSGELQRGIWLLSSALNHIGCPNARATVAEHRSGNSALSST